MAIPDCPTNGGSRVQAWWHQLTSDVHALARCRRGLSMHASWLVGWCSSAMVDGQHG